MSDYERIRVSLKPGSSDGLQSPAQYFPCRVMVLPVAGEEKVWVATGSRGVVGRLGR